MNGISRWDRLQNTDSAIVLTEGLTRVDPRSNSGLDSRLDLPLDSRKPHRYSAQKFAKSCYPFRFRAVNREVGGQPSTGGKPLGTRDRQHRQP